MASPQFIPLKKGKECFAVQSWRDSPSFKPSVPPVSEDLTKKKRRGKSKGVFEENFDDFIVKCVVPNIQASEVEQHLATLDAKCLRVMDIGFTRTAPLKRIEGDSQEKEHISVDEVPPSPPSALESGHLLCFLYAEQEQAEKAVAIVTKKWPTSTAEVVSRRRASLNASLVIKGLPFTTRCEQLVEELEKLTFKPSYVRLHRSERGVFKCVVFVKYANRAAAEHSKLELERLVVGSRPLKVEFKKKADPQKSSLLASLEQAIRDLRNSKENEGFFYSRSQLSKDEAKYLKHLAVSYDMMLELSSENITVKRRMGVDKPSPALRPTLPGTPQWVPATPGSLLPMDFRGIRHWKEMRQGTKTTMLGILRPLGPGETTPFVSGRGRPI